MKERRNKQYDIITLWICVYVLHTAIYASFCNHLCHLSISCLIICDGVSTHTLRLGALGDLRLLYCVYSVVYRLFVNAFMHSYLPKNKNKTLCKSGKTPWHITWHPSQPSQPNVSYDFLFYNKNKNMYKYYKIARNSIHQLNCVKCMPEAKLMWLLRQFAKSLECVEIAPIEFRAIWTIYTVVAI